MVAENVEKIQKIGKKYNKRAVILSVYHWFKHICAMLCDLVSVTILYLHDLLNEYKCMLTLLSIILWFLSICMS